MIKLVAPLSVLMVFNFLFVACKKKSEPTPQAVYDSTGVGQSAKSQYETLAKLKIASQSILLLADSTKTFDVNNAVFQFNDTLATTTYNTWESGFLQEVLSASNKSYNPLSADSANKPNGGVYYKYLINKNGVVFSELFEKMNLVHTLFHQINKIGADTLYSKSKTHKILVLSGINAAFPNTSTIDVSKPYDVYFGKFAAERDKNDGGGLYTQLKNQYANLQNAVLKSDSNSAYNNVNAVKRLLEKSAMASVVYHLKQTQSQLTLAATQSNKLAKDSLQAKALYHYNAAGTLVLSFKLLPVSERFISDYDGNILGNKLHINNDNVYSPIQLLKNNTTSNIDSAIIKIQNVYGFSADDIKDFATNWVESQKR